MPFELAHGGTADAGGFRSETCAAGIGSRRQATAPKSTTTWPGWIKSFERLVDLLQLVRGASPIAFPLRQLHIGIIDVIV